MGNEVSFTLLAKAFNSIEESHARADKTYKTVLERYSASAKVCVGGGGAREGRGWERGGRPSSAITSGSSRAQQH